MTDLSTTTAKLLSDVARTIENLDTSRCEEVRQVMAELRTANSARMQNMIDVRRSREEAARLISESLDDAERGESEFTAALERIERGLAAIAPAQVEARPKPRAVSQQQAAE